MENPNIPDGKLPLGLFKQASLKLDAFMTDCYEILEDPDLEQEDRDTMNTIIEVSGLIAAYIINIVSKEMGEEEFLNEQIPMDKIEKYPGDENDDGGNIIDEEIE